jgi:nucleoside-diphosphate-sugar epimerase
MTRLLITGASGFVGSHLVPALQALGHDVRCAAIKIDPSESQPDWTCALQDREVVIHLAARVHQMADKPKQAEAYYQINSLGTKHLAEQAAQQGIQRFIYLSSIKVYGDRKRDYQLDETSALEPTCPYGQSKLLEEQALQAVCQASAMEYVILRPPLIYGPKVKANFLKMLHWVQKGWPLPFASVKSRRSFLYIDNLVSALAFMVDNPQAANQIYVVGDESALSLADCLRGLSAQGPKTPLLPVPSSLLRALFALLGKQDLSQRLLNSLELDTAKIQSLGWAAPVPVQDGLTKTALWYHHDSQS